jgi:hypothetical protein
MSFSPLGIETILNQVVSLPWFGMVSISPEPTEKCQSPSDKAALFVAL